MKRISFIPAIAVIVALALLTPSALAQSFLAKKVVKIGEPVPEFILKDSDGKTVKRTDYRGKILMIVFWSANCPFSKRYDPRVNQIVKDYKSKDVNVIGIDSNSTENLDEIKKAIKDRDLQYSILIDSGNLIADQYGAITTPHAFIIDRSGLLVYEGAIDDQGWSDKNPITANYVRDALDATVTGEILVTPKTKPFGCTIKRAE